jgi:uncharacterized protein with HEPN domain
VPRHSPNQSLADALERIERAEAIVGTHGFAALQKDYVLADALLHNLLIASEAVTRLNNEWPERYSELEARYPNANWYAFRRFGDVLRHGYQIVDLAIVRRNLDDMIPAIAGAIRAELVLSTLGGSASSDPRSQA